jgi:hypothetical protein
MPRGTATKSKRKYRSQMAKVELLRLCGRKYLISCRLDQRRPGHFYASASQSLRLSFAAGAVCHGMSGGLVTGGFLLLFVVGPVGNWPAFRLQHISYALFRFTRASSNFWVRRIPAVDDMERVDCTVEHCIATQASRFSHSSDGSLVCGIANHRIVDRLDTMAGLVIREHFRRPDLKLFRKWVNPDD